jgi:hypothetical protein
MSGEFQTGASAENQNEQSHINIEEFDHELEELKQKMAQLNELSEIGSLPVASAIEAVPISSNVTNLEPKAHKTPNDRWAKFKDPKYHNGWIDAVAPHGLRPTG